MIGRDYYKKYFPHTVPSKTVVLHSFIGVIQTFLSDMLNQVSPKAEENMSLNLTGSYFFYFCF